MSPSPELLKISELARRAGVNRGTVQHYLREGLLPRPVKSHRNMAYYDAACVDRIRLIKDLQKRRFLPLHMIRRIVAGRVGGAQVKAAVEAQQAELSAVAVETEVSPFTVESAARVFDLPRRVIAELEKLGLVHARQEGRTRVFSGPDVEVLAAVGQLKRLGFTERAGFRTRDMLMYKKAVEGLLDQEIHTFLRTMSGKKPPAETSKLARAAIGGATALLVALRKKLIADLLASAGAETVDRVLAGER